MIFFMRIWIDKRIWKSPKIMIIEKSILIGTLNFAISCHMHMILFPMLSLLRKSQPIL